MFSCLRKSSGKSALGKSALVLFILSSLLPILGLPAFRYGWYTQIEFLVAGLWLVGGLAALWTLCLVRFKPKLAHFLYSMPVIWGWVPLIVLSVIVSLFQPAPLQSFTSNPQLGDGILTFVTLFFLSPIFVVISRLKPLKQWLLWLPALVIVLISTLTILGALGSPVRSLEFWKWAPVFFPDYITFFILALGVIYTHTRSQGTPSRPLDIFFSVLLITLIYYSRNHAILVGLALSLFTYSVIKAPLFKSLRPSQKLAYYTGAGLITLTVLVCLVNYLSDLPDAMLSLISRAQISQLTFIQYLKTEWTFSHFLTFLFGKGWGNYHNAAVSNLTLLKDFSLFNGDTYKSSLEFVDRDQVNSHNIFLEHFLALGALGVGLFCYIQYKIIQALRSKYFFQGVVFTVTLGILLIFWFQLPHTLPFITLASCLLFSKTPAKRLAFQKIKILPWGAGLAAPFLICISLTQFLSAYTYTTTLAIRPGQDLFGTIDKTTQSLWFAYDRYTGAHRTHQIMQGLSNDIFAYLLQEKEANLEKAGEKILHIVDHLQADIPQGSSLTSLILRMNILSKLSTHPKTVRLLQQDGKYQDIWHKTATHISHDLPNRSDILTPYFSFLIVTKQYEKIEKLCASFLSKRSDDPIAHWFLGTVYLNQNHRYEEGLHLMNQAISLGIQHYLPIPQNQVHQIQQAAQAMPLP